MSGVYAQISMSLDGFVAGPDDRPGNGLGAGGGAPLFDGALQDVELEVTEVVQAPRATHIRYRRVPS